MTVHILFVSTDNSARGIMAEAMLNHLASLRQRDVLAFSGGSSASGKVDHYTLEVLSGAGVEIGAYRNKSWSEFTRAGTPPMRIVIDLSDRPIHKQPPLWPGDPVHAHWPYPHLSGPFENDERKKQLFELTRQAIAYRVYQLLELPLSTMSGPELKQALAELAES